MKNGAYAFHGLENTLTHIDLDIFVGQIFKYKFGVCIDNMQLVSIQPISLKQLMQTISDNLGLSPFAFVFPLLKDFPFQ